jgi:hypothetical protein
VVAETIARAPAGAPINATVAGAPGASRPRSAERSEGSLYATKRSRHNGRSERRQRGYVCVRVMLAGAIKSAFSSRLSNRGESDPRARAGVTSACRGGSLSPRLLLRPDVDGRQKAPPSLPAGEPRHPPQFLRGQRLRTQMDRLEASLA